MQFPDLGLSQLPASRFCAMFGLVDDFHPENYQLIRSIAGIDLRIFARQRLPADKDKIFMEICCSL